MVFVTADSVFGHQLQADITRFVQQAGGAVTASQLREFKPTCLTSKAFKNFEVLSLDPHDRRRLALCFSTNHSPAPQHGFNATCDER
jgi:hypothetical protein